MVSARRKTLAGAVDTTQEDALTGSVDISGKEPTGCSVDISGKMPAALYIFQEKERRGECTWLRKTKGYALYVSQEKEKAGMKQKLFSYLKGRSVSPILISGKRKSWSYVGISGKVDWVI